MNLVIPSGDFGGYIFDCDGTLADTMPLHYRAWTRIVAELGGSFPEDLFYQLGGKPSAQILRLLRDDARILALIKPQFEATRGEVGKNGVIQDPSVHDRVIEEIGEFCKSVNLEDLRTCASSILGPAGNKEFFILARKKKSTGMNQSKQ